MTAHKQWLSYDAHGKRREVDWQPAGAPTAGQETPRGFTGHEHLDSTELIHMNGRVYEPTLGRFLSPDPVVQFPRSTQGLNRYTYTNNNPLSFTDPSGFLLSFRGDYNRDICCSDGYLRSHGGRRPKPKDPSTFCNCTTEDRSAKTPAKTPQARTTGYVEAKWNWNNNNLELRWAYTEPSAAYTGVLNLGAYQSPAGAIIQTTEDEKQRILIISITIVDLVIPAPPVVSEALWARRAVKVTDEALDATKDAYNAVKIAKNADRVQKNANKGKLNLFKWGDKTSTKADGWKNGDRFLYLPDKGSPKANWAQNYSRLREEMRQGNPIYDSYRDPVTGQQIPTRGFLNAERYTLESRGWRYDSSTGAYFPPVD